MDPSRLPSISRFEFTAMMCCNSMKCDPVEWPLDDLIWMLYSIQFAILLEKSGGQDGGRSSC